VEAPEGSADLFRVEVHADSAEHEGLRADLAWLRRIGPRHQALFTFEKMVDGSKVWSSLNPKSARVKRCRHDRTDERIESCR
jgi:hypothetical protein